MGAAYLNVSPIMDTLVLALLEAAANTSEKRAVSAAVKPKAVRASVTMSEVVPRSSPEAAAKLRTPSIPESISSVFQPAIAMYWNASAASLALNLVVAPISFALSVRASRSSPVEPEMAATVDMALSKLAVVVTAAAPKPTIGVVTFLVSDDPTDSNLSPTPEIFLPRVSILFFEASV